MKRIFSIVSAVGIGIGNVLAQSAPTPVGIGFANAVGLSSKTEVLVNGRTVKPTGFAAGGYATSLGLPVGSHELSFSNSGCEKKITQRVEVKEGTSPLYVLYTSVVSQPNGTFKQVLKLIGVPAQVPPRGPKFFVFSTLEARTATLNVNGQNLQFEPLKLTAVDAGSLTVVVPGSSPVRYDPSDATNYVLVLFDGVKSRLRSTFVEMAH